MRHTPGEIVAMSVLVVAFFALIIIATVWSCERQSECLHAKCSTPGMSPVWLHRDAECICAEVPE